MSINSAWARIHIIGGAGSGKTTLAQQLAQRLDAPCYHLDKIGYEDGRGAKRPLETRLADVEELIAQPKWITEGAFLWWTDGIMQTADVIVWLDLPVHINAWRIVARHVRLSMAGTNPHPGTRKLIRFMCAVLPRQTRSTPITPKAPDDDRAVTRVAMVEELSQYAEKVIRCRWPREVDALWARIQNEIQTLDPTR